jgi:hypothetical protein
MLHDAVHDTCCVMQCTPREGCGQALAVTPSCPAAGWAKATTQRRVRCVVGPCVERGRTGTTRAHVQRLLLDAVGLTRVPHAQHAVLHVTQRALNVTQRARNVTQRALNVTQRALSVIQRAHLSARQQQRRRSTHSTVALQPRHRRHVTLVRPLRRPWSVRRVKPFRGLESRHLESRPTAEARLDLEVSAG